MDGIRILIIEDDPKMRDGLIELLKDEGYAVDSAENGQSGLEKILKHDFDIVLTDLIMPGIGGMDVLRQTKRLRAKTHIIVITAFATIENAVEAMKAGASEYITKPFKLDEVQTKIRLVLEQAKFDEQDFETFDESTFKALSSPIRKKAVLLLDKENKLKFTQIQKALNIDDATKLSFHLRKLKAIGIIEQDSEKRYFLSRKGRTMLESFKMGETPQ